MATVLGIARKKASRAPMETLGEVRITCEAGLDGDYRGTSERRQVTVLAREAWESACREAGTVEPWFARRANLLVTGIDLADATGAEIAAGEVLLVVTGETKPCARMDEVFPGLRAALVPSWRAGACCRVLRGGTLRIGDPVELRRPPEPTHGAE